MIKASSRMPIKKKQFFRSNISMHNNCFNETLQTKKTINNKIKKMDLSKTIGEQSGNAKNHLDAVAVHSKQIKEMHARFNEDVQSLNKEILILKQKVKNNPLDLRKFLKQKLKPVENELLIGEQYQKNENKLNQQIMTEIKRQNKETSEVLIKTFQKLKQLEAKVGIYS